MTAEVLREAAELMRRFADDASPSPWASGLTGIWSENEERGGYIATDLHRHNPCENTRIDPGNRIHIAAWHPDVARAVADWLDAVAAGWAWDDDEVTDLDGNPLTLAESVDSHALNVARAFLGRQS